MRGLIELRALGHRLRRRGCCSPSCRCQRGGRAAPVTPRCWTPWSRGCWRCPAVVAATPVNAGRTAGGWDVPNFTVEGQDATTRLRQPALNFEAIGPRHLTRWRAHRARPGFTPTIERQYTVAIVETRMSRRGSFAPRTRSGAASGLGAPDSPEPWADGRGRRARTRYRELATARPTLYLPAAQFVDTAAPSRSGRRRRLDGRAAISGQIEAIDPGVRVLRVATFGTIVAGPLAQPGFNVTVSTAFALTAAALAAIGLYAACGVGAERHREIAIRIAIGATPRSSAGWSSSRRCGSPGSARRSGVQSPSSRPDLASAVRLTSRSDDPSRWAGPWRCCSGLFAGGVWPIRAADSRRSHVSLRA